MMENLLLFLTKECFASSLFSSLGACTFGAMILQATPQICV